MNDIYETFPPRREDMKILMHMVSLSARGGAERTLLGLAAELTRRGHTVSISVCDPEGTPSAYPVPSDIKVIYLTPKRDLWWALSPLCKELKYHTALKEHVGSQPYDIILGWARYGGAMVGWLPTHIKAARLAAIRTLPHGTGSIPLSIKGLVEYFYTRWSYARADGLFMQLPQFKEVIPEAWQEKCAIIPNAVEFPQDPLPEEGVKENLVIAVARMVGRKRLSDVVRGFAIFHKQHPDWTLEIWGEGKPRARRKLHKLIERSGLSDAARLMGITRDIGSVYARARVLCHPSRSEGMSNSVTEAMARGLTVIGCSDCRGMGNLIQDQQTGYLITGHGKDASLSEKIGHALSDLAADPAKADHLGQNAQQYIIKEYAPQRVYDLWEEKLALRVGP